MTGNSSTQSARATIDFDPQSGVVYCRGNWTVFSVTHLATTWQDKLSAVGGDVIIDGNDISHFDTSGAWLLENICQFLVTNCSKVRLQSFRQESVRLHDIIKKSLDKTKSEAKAAQQKLSFTESCGYKVFSIWLGILNFLNFMGEVSTVIASSILDPKKIQWRLLLNTIESAGYRAMPIIFLLSFLIGIVLTYQMGGQLKTYGASIYITDLLGIAVLREFGPLLTAIIIAGRTGASFTAQIGTMKINEEIDAIQTMGLSPMSFLVLPKIFAMLISVPLLTLLADIAGIFGGMYMAKVTLGIDFMDFLARFQSAVSVDVLFFGLMKAPVFAIIITLVGCYQGMMVRGSATSVGVRTTVSVVQSIFIIIVADALFSLSYAVGGV